MNRYQIIVRSLVIISLLLLNSCDYYSSYDFNIKNNTDQDLFVKTFRENSDMIMEIDDSFTISPNTETTLFISSGGNCSKDCPVNPLSFEYLNDVRELDSISVSNNLDIVDYSYINLLSNWTFYSRPQVGVYEFEITDSNFD